MGYKILFATLVGSAFMLFSPIVSAADMDNKGLSLSPVRQELSVSQGKDSFGSVEVANLTDKPMTINLSIKEFSVVDFTYDFKFNEPKSQWIKLDRQSVVLQPGKKERIRFTLTAPTTLPPGGHYYALFASTDMSTPTFKQTAQVVSQFFIKADGKLIRSGSIENGKVPFLNMGSSILYQFDAENTGNIHYSASVFGRLESLIGKLPESDTSHALMPGTKRTVGGSVSSPLLPGVYKLTYGYKTDANSIISSKSEYILFIPPWSIIAVFIMLFGIWKFSGRDRTEKNNKVSKD